MRRMLRRDEMAPVTVLGGDVAAGGVEFKRGNDFGDAGGVLAVPDDVEFGEHGFGAELAGQGVFGDVDSGGFAGDGSV